MDMSRSKFSRFKIGISDGIAVLVVLLALAISKTAAQTPALRGWYMSSTGPICSNAYAGGTMDPALTAQPPDTLFVTWTLGDERATPLTKASEDMQAKMKAAITAGNIDTGLAPMFAPTFVEHSPFKPDGPDGALAHYKVTAVAGYEYQPIIEVYDGPMAAILSRKKFAERPDQMASMDFWLAAGGKFYEHWDMMRPNTGPNMSGRTLFDPVTMNGPTTAQDRQRNKELVVNAINDCRNLKWPNCANQYFADDYMVHDIGGMDGKAAIPESIAKYPDIRWDIKYVLADDDLVAVLSRVTFTVMGNMTAYSVGEIYRVKDCKLTEHWQVTEKLPPMEMYKNRNGAF